MNATWQSVYRSIIDARKYSTLTLAGLVYEIEHGGKRLCHGVSTQPYPLFALRLQKCEGACLVGWLEAQERDWLDVNGNPLSVDEVEILFAAALATLAPGRWPHLGNWWDDPANAYAPRMVAAETRLIIEERLESAA